MNIATETNSLINHIYSRSTNGQPAPNVGMGVTFLYWTDRKAGTIQKVWELSSKQWLWEIEATEDVARRTDGNGMSEDQTYEYEERPDGVRKVFRCKRATGEWVEMRRNENGKMVINRGTGLMIGHRQAYHDFSF